MMAIPSQRFVLRVELCLGRFWNSVWYILSNHQTRAVITGEQSDFGV